MEKPRFSLKELILNSKCWPGYKKVGVKDSPSGTGETVNDCEKI